MAGESAGRGTQQLKEEAMDGPEARVPMARKDALVIQQLPDEMLVYDQRAEKAHSLNRAASLIWQHCDGQLTIGGLAEVVGQELQAPVDTQYVWYGLRQLADTGLLQDAVIQPVAMAGLSRRQFLRKLGIATAATMVPVILSIKAPTPEAAAYAPSPKGLVPYGGRCGGGKPCAPGLQCLPGPTGALICR